jgi:hypothetical protein
MHESESVRVRVCRRVLFARPHPHLRRPQTVFLPPSSLPLFPCPHAEWQNRAAPPPFIPFAAPPLPLSLPLSIIFVSTEYALARLGLTCPCTLLAAQTREPALRGALSSLAGLPDDQVRERESPKSFVTQRKAGCEIARFGMGRSIQPPSSPPDLSQLISFQQETPLPRPPTYQIERVSVYV